MTATSYLQGCVALAVAVVPLALAAVRARALLVPAWRGLPARLGEITLSLAGLLAVLHVLGAVGLFRRLPAVLGCAAAGLVAVAVLGRRRPDVDPEPAPDAPAPPTWWVAAAVAVMAVTAAQWAAPMSRSLRVGIREIDSNWYHLPHAARFVQEGWITRLHFTAPEFPSMFHPADAELFHALGMLLFRGDLLSPVLNLAWAALAIAAAWGIGRPWGHGPISAVGVAVLLATGELAALQPGAATNDASTIAMLLVVAALLVQPGRDTGATVIAGTAAGIAIGLKLTMLAPIGVLTLALVVLAVRRRERAAALGWLVPLAVVGSFWYLRNLVRAGNPMPSLDIGLLPAPTFAIVEEQGWSIAHYIGDGAVWRDLFRPGLDVGLGSAWWAILAVCLAGLVLVLARGTEVQRVLALAAGAGVAAYIVMPTSAMGPEGQPVLFFVTLRYAFGPLAILLALLPTVAPRSEGRASHVLLAVYGVLFAVTSGWHRSRILASWDRTEAAESAVAAVAVLVALAAGAFLIRRRPPRIVLQVVAVGAAVLLVGAGYAAQRRYVNGRYSDEVWAVGLDARIAVVGHQQYPYYGPTLENHVQHLGQVDDDHGFHDLTSCAELRQAVVEDRYGFVVSDTRPGSPPGYEDWLAADPAAALVASHGTVRVYGLDGTSSPTTCPP